MDQIITTFICKIPSLLALIPLTFIFDIWDSPQCTLRLHSPEYLLGRGKIFQSQRTLRLHSPEYLLKTQPYNKDMQTISTGKKSRVLLKTQPHNKDMQTDLKIADIHFAASKQSCSLFKASLIFSSACSSFLPSTAKLNDHPHFTSSKTRILYANNSSKQEKDEILEELKLSAQGIVTDSETNQAEESSVQARKNGLTPSKKEKINKKNTPAQTKTTGPTSNTPPDQKSEINQKNNPTQTKITEPSSQTPSDQKEESPTDKNKDLEFSTVDSSSLTESTESPANNEDSEIQEYSANPSRIKKEKLEKKLNDIIHKNPKNETAHWTLFELYHHYMEWSQDTEFYQENHPFQTLKLLQDMYKKFGENPKIMKYLCHYFVINHLYVESKTYCQKAKKLLPDDTDLHLYADYFNESAESSPSDQSSSLSKSQRLLNLLKTKPPSEKLYTIIGKMFADKKKDKLSMKYFHKAVKLNDSYIPGLLGLSETLLRLGQYQPALKYYVLACQKHPYKSRTPFQKAKAYLNRKSLFKTASEYQKQINICINSIKTSH